MSTPQVAILTGSPSDMPKVKEIEAQLSELGVSYTTKVLSAHRTPDRACKFVETADAAGVQVFIACAGLAAHLAGVVAAHTLRPVIGVPLAGGTLGGMDSLLSTAQMPSGIPVATVAINGAKNAAILATQILSLNNADLRTALAAQREAATGRYDSADL